LSSKRNDSFDEKLAIAKRVANYLIGDQSKGIEPLNISKIAEIMRFKSRKSVYQYRDLAIQQGLIELDDQGKPILPKVTPLGEFKTFSEKHSLLENPIIAHWWKKQSAKNSGHGIKMQKPMFNMLERFFNTVKINPEELVAQKSNEVVESWRDKFIEDFKNNQDARKSQGNARGSLKGITLRLNYALNSLCVLNGIAWAKGDRAMSRQIVGHGKYSKERFTKQNFLDADQYLIENYGIDSDEYRWFWVGVETCSRSSGLKELKLEYEEIKNSDGTTKSLVMQGFESKSQHTKKGGDVEKFVRRSNTIESLKALHKRGTSKNRIFENKDGVALSTFFKEMTEKMRGVYTSIGKDLDSYYFKRPNHTLRHLGAQYWLEKGNYTNHVIVAKIGHWATIQELIDSYGGVPAEVFQNTLDGYNYDD
jgi:integrase